MKGQGGWPLNVVCLPDGKPVWGGTYVPKEKWMQVLAQLAEMFQSDRKQMEDYGENLSRGIQQSMLISLQRSPFQIAPSDLDEQFAEWQATFDKVEGGSDRAPKFPMPTNWNYLLEYAVIHDKAEAMAQLELSLDKMAQGGIYDQIGGGFSRYSVDGLWKVPHFEKMLYDNAQMLALYSKAYRKVPKDSYHEIIQDTWEFLKRELRDDSGAWFSALDADSEGVEGLFYTWEANELQEIIPSADWALFAAFYNINEWGYWEDNRYILLRREEDRDLAERFQISVDSLKLKKHRWKELLMAARGKRIRPGLDNKALCSWNALMITGACEAYKTFGEPDYLDRAIQTASWILESQSHGEHRLWHAWQDGEAHIEGLLEDYAHCIEAFLVLWQVSGKEQYLHQAEAWTQVVLEEFEDSESGLFNTRPHSGESLISRGLETQDNVIPSANSVMAHNLHLLGLILGKSAWLEQAQQNLGHLKSSALNYPESFANWSRLALYMAHPFHEIALIGAQAPEQAHELFKELRPLEFIFYTPEASDLTPFKGRYQANKTLIYPCQSGSCQAPFSDLASFKKEFKGG